MVKENDEDDYIGDVIAIMMMMIFMIFMMMIDNDYGVTVWVICW